MKLDYEAFLASKTWTAPDLGAPIDPAALHPELKPFQRAIVAWALRKGRAAVFADTGLGKTLMQLEWARRAGNAPIILAPLAVAQQTVGEAARWGHVAKYCRSQADVDPGVITVTNYERLGGFNPAAFDVVVLDESSILKSYDGKVRTAIIEAFGQTPYRLACTATPAPNDIAEIANHAEFLGLMTRAGMLATYFVHDQDGWRLKRPAEREFYRWMASWAVFCQKPSDLGDYDDTEYDLPPLTIGMVAVPSDYVPDGQLIAVGLKGVGDRARVRKGTLAERVRIAAERIASEPDQQWLAWCGLNDEGRELARLVPGAVLVEGNMTADDKADKLLSFARGEFRVLVTKPSIAGMGMNFQSCARQVFVGLGDSYEQYYQAIRRCWRFGQTEPVDVSIVLTDIETEIYDNVLRKQEDFQRMRRGVMDHVAEFQRIEQGASVAQTDTYRTDDASGNGWRVMLGDSAERIAEIPDASVDMSIFSPPFLSLFQYSNSERDMGNCKTPAEFWDHFRWIRDGLLRVMKPGRNVCVHVAQVGTTLAHHGTIGLQDFRGMTIAHFVAGGFIYHGDVVIDKDPQAQAIRTHSKALLFVQKEKDSAWLRPALADYILVFRAPGDNETPIKCDLTNNEWIEWARPIWYGIRESDTLNTAEGKGQDDERHICPLQLGTIHRCIRLWSNPGETVFSPFAGIGSELYEAIRLKRRALGIELKESYWRTAVKNCRRAESLAAGDLFAWAEGVAPITDNVMGA